MTERVMELLRALGGTGQEEALRALCVSACRTLERRLREGVSPEDCGEAYPLAAAWLALDWLRDGQGLSGVTAVSAGDMSVRMEEGAGTAEACLGGRWSLWGPTCATTGLCFRGCEVDRGV